MAASPARSAAAGAERRRDRAPSRETASRSCLRTRRPAWTLPGAPPHAGGNPAPGPIRRFPVGTPISCGSREDRVGANGMAACFVRFSDRRHAGVSAIPLRRGIRSDSASPGHCCPNPSSRIRLNAGHRPVGRANRVLLPGRASARPVRDASIRIPYQSERIAETHSPQPPGTAGFRNPLGMAAAVLRHPAVEAPIDLTSRLGLGGRSPMPDHVAATEAAGPVGSHRRPGCGALVRGSRIRRRLPPRFWGVDGLGKGR